MLLLHQIGSVKIGEVVRYTVTYTPSADRILPSPEHLFLRIRNSSAMALRAAFVHGPYTLSVAAYPSNFHPDRKFAQPRRYGVPEFEPMLKAGGSWSVRLVVPDDIRQGAGDGAARGFFGAGPGAEGQSASWVIEVASQVIFSASAAVHFEVLLARDEKSLNGTGSLVLTGGSQAQAPQPGRVSDYQRGRDGQHPDQPRGVFSRAVGLKVEDTGALWNTPLLPGWEAPTSIRTKADGNDVPVLPQETKKPLKVHLVVLTHGLHGNLGGDMLYLKESIDGAVRQAKVDKKARLAKERAAKKKNPAEPGSEKDTKDATEAKVEEEEEAEEDDDDDEEVVVRGFSGNATKTERGIKYLGKRLAHFVLSMTYPDQPYLPASKAAAAEAVSNALHGGTSKSEGEGKPAHKHSTILKANCEIPQRGYKITKISFISHSLGGLVQTYGIAYIQKHSPQFFDIIKPINFVALASPFLGLNHENPLYVKFALDFGLVGRTGQDLGLTWRAPTIARSGWGAIVNNLGESTQKKLLGEAQPESKPLLRILPTGPAHTALKKFRNRTVYSNVVNDGIVPLRTSCLLFLDWQGLERVEKARRETGLVETLVGAGWAELMGANVTSPRIGAWEPRGEKGSTPSTRPTTADSHHPDSHEVPQPPADATLEDDRQSLRTITTPRLEDPASHLTATTSNAHPFTGLFNFFRSIEPSRSEAQPSQKQKQIYQRSQTLKVDDSSATTSAASSRSRVTAGNDHLEEGDGVSAPPRTSFFESATDLINPNLPSVEYLIDPTKRPRTIFHDRVYHPWDIPPPPLKKRPVSTVPSRRLSFHRTSSSTLTNQSSASNASKDSGSKDSTASSPYPSPAVVHEDSMASTRDYDDTIHTNPDKDPDEVIDSSNMKVEEKIARAYHRGLSWRKVLVKLEPDAHNNLIVRRQFANAFGWPVIKHLVDAHFSDSASARMRDEEEASSERAKDPNEAPDEHGAETKTQAGVGAAGDGAAEPEPDRPRDFALSRTNSEAQEARDTVPDLPASPHAHSQGSEDRLLAGGVAAAAAGTRRPGHVRLDSLDWSDRDWADSEESDGDEEHHHLAYGQGQQGEGPGLNTAVGMPERGRGGGQRGASPLAGAWNWTENIVGKGKDKEKEKETGTKEDGMVAGAEGERTGSGSGSVAGSGQDDID